MANIRSMTMAQFHEYLAPSPGCECDLCAMYRLCDVWDDWAWNQGFESSHKDKRKNFYDVPLAQIVETAR